MRHDKLERELYLLQLLVENRAYTVAKLCEKVGISRRNLYYYLEFFRDCGFVVYKRGQCYAIDRNSPFFGHIIERVSFTQDEAVVIRRLLEKADQGNAVVANLRNKMDRFYDFDILSDVSLREQAAHNISRLHEAIKFKQMAVLKNYTSPHSATVRDRLVEPFLLLNNNNEVRCYEPSSGLNKTFKIARMEDVQVLNQTWDNEAGHRIVFTDAFMFSGEEQMEVTLSLGTLSYNILREEYPAAATHAAATPDGRHTVTMKVCSYNGIGRFVLGLYDDVRVAGDQGFKDYLKGKMCRYVAE